MFSRRQIAALLGEFLGTAGLTLVVLAVSKSTIGLPYFVALATGLAVTILTFAFSTSNTGAHLNPAITLGLWTIRKVKTLEAVLFIALQLIGAYLAYLLFSFFINQSLPTTVIEFSNRLLIAEAVGAFVLAFGWAAAIYKGYKGIALSATVGLAYLTGILVASAAASGLLNPALALGVAQWQWGTYVLGPVLGALIGFNLYSLLFAAPEKVVTVTAETAVISDDVVAAEEPKKPAKKPVVAKAATVKAPKTTDKKVAPKAKRVTKK